MFIVLYRWRIKPQLEEQFIKAWSRVTDYYVENFDSLGSRLHRGNDGIWYAYAQWKSEEQRDNAFQNSSDKDLETAREKMYEAVMETMPATKLEVVSDLLKTKV